VGEGDETARLKSIAQELNLRNVHFVGFKSGDDLARYYAAADVFVFPSLIDVWGLVVNEALASGLRVLGSQYAGSVQELAAYPESHGVLEAFDPLNTGEFTALLRKWCESDETMLSSRAYELISRINYKISIDAFRTVISRCAGGNPDTRVADGDKSR
jgi:glycosyltransferase involved in cell wall biosynthesis